jgi:hypothetical protein
MEQKNLAVIRSTDLHPVSKQVYQQLTMSNCEAAEIFHAANCAPAIGKLGPDELNEAVKHILKSVTILTGIKIPEDDLKPTLMLMKKIVPVHYGKLTHHEIVHAFELNAMGKLIPHSPEKKIIHHYQSFTMDYLGGVLSAYMRHRNELAPTIQQTFQAIAHEAQKQLPPPSPEAQRDESMQFIAERRIEYAETGRIFLASMTHDYLVDLGLLDPDTWKKYVDRARYKLIGQKTAEGAAREAHGTARTIGQIMEVELLKSGGGDEVDGMARRMCVYDYFDNKLMKDPERCFVYPADQLFLSPTRDPDDVGS